MTNDTDKCREKINVGLDMMAKTFAQWVDFNSGNDESHVISPPVWPTVGVLKAWIVTLQRAQNTTPPIDVKRVVAVLEAKKMNITGVLANSQEYDNGINAAIKIIRDELGDTNE